MILKTTNYKQLIAGILAFYVIMKLDQELLMAGDRIEIIKAVIGAVVFIYLVYNAVSGYRLKKQGEAKPE